MSSNAQTAANPDSGRFDVIPYSDLSHESTWTRLGRGSFGCVFKGLYLGLEVAIKEVLNSDEYNVDKYFKRECTLMKECRHPNIVQFIGLCLAPSAPPEYLPPLQFDDQGSTVTKPPLAPRRRILIISEYLPHGNLRGHIVNQKLDFSWRLRLSFAVDVARAVAYLHARNCLHRDLKGENLLITENDRIKVCDFGFARLAARNEEEMRRMSYCGTDGYMSPEILIGEEFGLETDIFSLGVIFCEIASRRLVDDYHFKRVMPTFGLDEDEIRDRASAGCPPAFLDLAIACVSVEPADRPKIRVILDQLRAVEREIIEAQTSSAGYNVGSLTFGAKHAGRRTAASSKAKRPPGPGRIPSFQGQVQTPKYSDSERDAGDSSSDEDVEETIAKLETLKVGNGKGSFYMNPINAEATSKLLGRSEDGSIKYSVIKPNKQATRSSFLIPDADAAGATSSIMTLKAMPTTDSLVSARSAFTLPESWIKAAAADQAKEMQATEEPQAPAAQEDAPPADLVSDSTASSDTSTPVTPSTERSAEPVMPGSLPESKFATIKSLSMPIPATPESMDSAASSIQEGPSPHRFTLIKPGWRALWEGNTPYVPEKAHNKRISLAPSDGKRSSMDSNGSGGGRKSMDGDRPNNVTGGLAAILPIQLLGAGLLTRCSMCEKRLGLMKPYLACDDCQQIFHVKCGDMTSANCQGLHHQQSTSASSESSSVVVVPGKDKGRKGKRESSRKLQKGSPSSSVVIV